MVAGLSALEATHLLKKNGSNSIPEKHDHLVYQILKKLASPVSIMLIIASVLSFWLGKLFDGYFILFLLLLNMMITLWQEYKADSTIRKLNDQLSQKVKVARDGHWTRIESRYLVPGDIVQLSAGELIPADGTIQEGHNVSVNESSLTGESLAKDKHIGDAVFSGSYVVSGIATVKITQTGAHTKFGRTMLSIETIQKRSLLEKDILTLSRNLTILSGIAVVVLSAVLLAKQVPFLEVLTLDLSLVIAGIPISLPTVMTLIIEFGVIELAKKNAVVRRISALEDLANVNFLLTDKTGTLTQNKITIKDMYSYNGFTHSDILRYATIVAAHEADNQIDKAILEKSQEQHVQIPIYKEQDFIPADSERKRSTVTIIQDETPQVITLGAPQIVISLSNLPEKEQKAVELQVAELATRGYRTLALAFGDRSTKEENLTLVGLLALSDSLRTDAVSVVSFLQQNGIDVSIVTGDNHAIAAQIAQELGLGAKTVMVKKQLDSLDLKQIDGSFFKKISAFAEVLPEDKLKLVQKAKEFFTIAANGDGVNDLPAVKAADVGVAVKNAVSVLKATADIVLLTQGISVIRDAIIESRKIFERIYVYSVYRISESLRLIVTIAVLGVLFGQYPLNALQIILLALLNDIPIISLAFDRVKIANKPKSIHVKDRFLLSSIFGSVGILNSLILFFIMTRVWHYSWPVVETMYFLKLTVSGHLLIYIAHTKERWYTFLPSKEVIWATTITQLIATICAVTGFLMPGHLTIAQAIFVWVWSFFWMQIGEVLKQLSA